MKYTSTFIILYVKLKVDSSGKESINILLAMSPEPSLLAYIKYGCRLRRNSKFRLVSVGALGAFACDKNKISYACILICKRVHVIVG